jgi:hypothetical protein
MLRNWKAAGTIDPAAFLRTGYASGSETAAETAIERVQAARVFGQVAGELSKISGRSLI